MFLHCFFWRHVSALAMSHLQTDNFFLCKANHGLPCKEKSDQMFLHCFFRRHVSAEKYRWNKQCKNTLLIKNLKQVVFDYILPIYFMILIKKTGMSHLKVLWIYDEDGVLPILFCCYWPNTLFSHSCTVHFDVIQLLLVQLMHN
jgi:hypothetical protein